MTEKPPKKIKRGRGLGEAVDLSRPPTTSVQRRNERASQTVRNKKIKITLPSTPWEQGNG